VRAFEQGLLQMLRVDKKDILEDIRKSGDLADATAAKLKSAVESYAKTFA
jgi:F-type H+-transporting ATPase subunit alpha